MSAESGVPTYRGPGGIWGEYDYRSCACQEAFEADPEHVWGFHNLRRELVGACAPNLGHDLIAGCARATVVTQNIDGLHQLAGSTRVHELHGSLWRVRDPVTGARREGRESPLEALRTPSGGWWRPDIVWFGDQLDHEVISAAVEAIAGCDLLVSIGTSAVVYPAAQLPLVATKGGAVTVEINLEDTPLSHIYQHRLRGPAGRILQELFAA